MEEDTWAPLLATTFFSLLTNHKINPHHAQLHTTYSTASSTAMAPATSREEGEDALPIDIVYTKLLGKSLQELNLAQKRKCMMKKCSSHTHKPHTHTHTMYTDWLLDRKKVSPKWHDSLRSIRQQIDLALGELQAGDESAQIATWLKGKGVCMCV